MPRQEAAKIRGTRPEGTRYTVCPWRPQKTATGSHAGPAGSITTSATCPLAHRPARRPRSPATTRGWDDVTDVVCTDLHPDHVGWLFDLESRPNFPCATIWFGAGDWRYFIEGRHTPLIQDHVDQGFRSHLGDARLRPIDRDTTVAPGITANQTP